MRTMQVLTPRMIQSMEILQLPLQKLEERIEQELQNNPVLETSEDEGEPTLIADGVDGKNEVTEDERAAWWSKRMAMGPPTSTGWKN